MSAYRISADAESDLDGIWLYIARESGDIDRATRFVDRLYGHFKLLAKNPSMGRGLDALQPGCRGMAFAGYMVFYTVVEEGEILILHVRHGSRRSLTQQPN